MRALFNLASRIDDRKQAWQQVNTLWHKVDRDKIISLLDMDHCFFGKDLHYRGVTGMRYLTNCKLVEMALQSKINDGMPLFDFPSTLAEDHTKETLQDEILRIIAATGNPPPWDLDAVEERVEDHLENSRLQAVYLGDYLDTLNSVFSLHRTAQFDALWSKGEQSMTILNAVMNLPDYTHLFPDRGPPHNGNKRKQREPGPSVPAFRPILFPA